jgi:acetyl-CoA carboxylase alpha subunit
MVRTLKSALLSALKTVRATPIERLLETRYERLMRYGEYEEH